MSLYPDFFIAIADQCDFITKIRLRQICKILFQKIKIKKIPKKFIHLLTPEILATLSDLKKQKTVVFYYCSDPNSWCTKMRPEWEELRTMYQNSDIKLCKIPSTQSSNYNKSLARHLGFTDACPEVYVFPTDLYYESGHQLMISDTIPECRTALLMDQFIKSCLAEKNENQ